MEKIEAVSRSIKAKEMTHKEFVRIIRSSPFCRPIRRVFPECELCKMIGAR